MPSRPPHYRAFLLRFWEERSRPRNPKAPTVSIWRFSLEDPRTGERLGFADFKGLTSFLLNQIEELVQSAGSPGPPAQESGSADTYGIPPVSQDGTFSPPTDDRPSIADA